MGAQSGRGDGDDCNDGDTAVEMEVVVVMATLAIGAAEVAELTG